MPISQSPQPFWIDKLDETSIQKVSKIFYPIFIINGVISVIFIIGFGWILFHIAHPILAWMWLVLIAISTISGYIRKRHKKLEIQRVNDIQKRALEKTGASVMGSAIHVAGVPQLKREQNVVLALIEPNLVVFSYDYNQPLVTIPIQKIITVQTVVYDDERIPHIDVVDASAQAIQLILNYDKQEIACLFRNMKKIRPIDWYHAIQKVRTGFTE
jgi:hypothetical protein